MGSITSRCIYCQVECESFACASCLEIAKQENRELEASRQAAKALQDAQDNERAQGVMVEMRRHFAADQANAAQDTDLETRERAVKARELSQREHRQDRAEPEPFIDDTPTPQTFADHVREVTLEGVDRLPSALQRSDGATLIYEGRFNTLYGEVSVGKSWIALMVVIQRLRAGRNVIWMDSEDRPETLAKRLQVLRATDLIGHPALKWTDGAFLDAPAVMAEALEFLGGGNGPGLIVIDSATSFGCPSDGANVTDWQAAHIEPWWNAGHTVLLLDHVPKRKLDRPRGGIGSQQKLSRIDGSALYAHGTPWNGTEAGFVNLQNHKDRHGQLPATLMGAVATISAEWGEDKLTLDYTIAPPNTKAEAEDVQDELLEAIDQAGPEGVRGSRAIRELMKGKRGKDVDLACEELTRAGMLDKVQDGRAFIYKVAQ